MPRRKEPSKQSMCRFLILFVCMPLVLGTINYLIFRPDTYIVEFIGRIVGIIPKVPQGIPAWLKLIMCCYLSDALWACSLASIVFIIGKELLPSRWGITALTLGFAAGLELLQIVPCFHGTFDPLDIIVEAIIILVVHQILRKREKSNEKSPKSY